MTEIDDSLSQSELVEIVHQLNVQMDDVEDTTAVKEKDIIHSNRVKLTDYIHDSTVLFPYMKQHGVFSVYDCDVIKGESVAHNRMDKFIDVLFTKGPKAIGVFHESLAKTYPGVFDYLTRLFTSANIDLPDTRRMRPASVIDQVDPGTLNVSYEMNQEDRENSAESDLRYWGRTVSRRGLTVRKSLDMLSRQLDAIQKERNELKNALTSKEKEISDLIKSKEKSRDDLLSITQHYQEIYRNLVDWKESLSSDSSQRLQELLAERECIQAEYDALENDYALVQLELRAARERISRLMSHLERSEQLVAFAHEERDALQNKVIQLEGEIQRLERKKFRDLGAGKGNATGGRREGEIEQLAKQIEQSHKDLETARVENADLSDRLTVARQERNEALAERDEILKKQYLEEQKRKKAENEVRLLYKRLQQMKDSTSHSSDESYNAIPSEGNAHVKMEDFTTVIQASDDMGLKLGLGVLVADVSDHGLAMKCGVKAGDQICQINHIIVTSDHNPLDLCHRLLHNASKVVTLLIRRPVLSYETKSNSSSQHQTNLSSLQKIHQITKTSDSPGKTSTIGRFALPLHSTNSFPTSNEAIVGSLPASYRLHPGAISCDTSTASSMALNTKSLSMKRKAFHRKPRRKNSDEHSSYTSSSDDYPPDIKFTESTDTTNSGIVYSPDATTACRFIDDDIPDTVTRPPTLVEELNLGGVQFSWEEDNTIGRTGTLKQRSVDDENGISYVRPKYLPMYSSPASNTIEKSTTPKLKRAEARKWMYRNRRSQSLVDMSTLIQDDKSPQSDLKHRRVILPWGQFGNDITILGGRGHGIFICSKKEDSRGLQTGDEILKIDDISTHAMTYRDFFKTLESVSKRDNQCMITVHSNIEGYTKVQSSNERDSFYIKTLFSHKRTCIAKEIAFKENEVFKVIDSFPDGVKNMWRVKKINPYGTEEDEGYIPIDVCSSDSWEQGTLSSNSLPAIFRFPLAKRLNSSPGPDTIQSLREAQSNINDLYQPIKMIKVNAPRPVILLGICEEEIKQCLIEESVYSLPPIRSIGSLPLLKDECSEEHIVLKRTGENVKYCLVTDVLAIGEHDQHCILSVEPAHVLNNKTLSKLHPIILFLYTRKTGSFGFKFQVHNCSSETINKYLSDMKLIEERFSSCFTGRVEVSGGMDNIVKQVKCEILAQQQMVVWQKDHTLGVF